MVALAQYGETAEGLLELAELVGLTEEAACVLEGLPADDEQPFDGGPFDGNGRLLISAAARG